MLFSYHAVLSIGMELNFLPECLFGISEEKVVRIRMHRETLDFETFSFLEFDIGM